MTPGTIIAGKLRLVGLLGVGGMGSVWVADHLALQARVAVKFLDAELVARDATALARFQREALLAASMKSPHVVTILDHGLGDGGEPYIVMELLHGESLEERLEGGRPLTLPEVVTVIEQTARALGRAHQLGIVHRDIKPANLFLVHDEDEGTFVKVLDFGVAKQQTSAVSSMTATGAMVGTPLYMSPEQVLSSKSVDFRSDLWSLAVVAYNALTGVVPFDAETLGGVYVAIASGVFAPPTELRPELPRAIDAFFARALATDPQQRFDSARELARAFAAALAAPAPSLALAPTQQLLRPAHGLGTLGGATVPSERRGRARRVLAIGGALTALALAAVGALALRPASGSAAPAPALAAAVLERGASQAAIAAPPLPAPVESEPAPSSTAATSSTAARAPVRPAAKKPRTVDRGF